MSKVYYKHAEVTLLLGDVRESLSLLASNTVHCVITSPPYWKLRDYRTEHVEWENWVGELGQESDTKEYIKHLVEVFREVKRVLRQDGTLWVNIAGSYASDGRGGGEYLEKKMGVKTSHTQALGPNKAPEGFKAKDWIPIPWMLGLALIEDGWYLRSDIIWNVNNAMPESVTDRPVSSHEYILLFSKSPVYYYDHIAVQEPLAEGSADRYKYSFGGAKAKILRDTDNRTVPVGIRDVPITRNQRNVWTLNTESYSGSHFAVFPKTLVAPCIKAGTSEYGCCDVCGKPYERVIEKREAILQTWPDKKDGQYDDTLGKMRVNPSSTLRQVTSKQTVDWHKTCYCQTDKVVSCTVLDPFVGSGTTCFVAKQLGRNSIGIDIKSEYLDLAIERVQQDTLKFT